MSRISQQTEWLSMIEVSGPFLAISVLEKVFPQGLDAIEAFRRKRTRSAYDEWCDAIDENDPRLEDYHREWVRLVLTEILKFDDSVLLPCDKDDDSEIVYKSPDSMKTFAPDSVLSSGTDEKPHFLVSIQPPGTDLEKVKLGDGWPASIIERMILLCRTAGVRLGLVTNGERWMLVNAPVGSTSSHASWYARIWFQEPVTLKAFQSLLGVRRWFGPEDETLPALLEESLQHHEEVTDTLGEQVRRAVEVLIQCLDKADQDRNRELLRDVPAAELYEAGLTVMMRLVFVLCAEERALLLLGDPTYDQHYAITTLRGQLTEEADRHGPEVLERRHDAWARLLAVFRAVYGGVEHEMLRMPALGGSLFDPDRFPFLEGRSKETNWKDEPAKPVPIDNRTVLLLLNALQVLEQRGGALLLSYKALDVEQIGHVYEGLLEHTVERLPKVTLGLIGSKKAKNPNLAIDEMASALLDGEKAFADMVEESTLRSLTAIKNAFKKDVDDETFGKVITVCSGDLELANRIRPFANLLRADAWGDFIVYRANSFAVSLGTDRRETGTHYTPKSLTESIVETTLEPVAYVGPAEGKPREDWKLKSPAEILDLKICDPAMGSGAFLVQVCRWLAERLVEAWGNEEAAGRSVTVDGMVIDNSNDAELMPSSMDDRLIIARRLVAEKCLYGVDMNPLAVELAKLSIWLVTLSKGRPFGFLDHNFRCGDSLLGIHKLEQLTEFSLTPERKKNRSIFASNIEIVVTEVIELRTKLRETPIRDIRDVQTMKRLDKEARKKLENIEQIADAMIGEVLQSGGNARTLEEGLNTLSTWANEFIQGDSEFGHRIIAQAQQALSVDLPAGRSPRKPFHWVLEFPEVFGRGGFDGIVGNPPYSGGKKIGRQLGQCYRDYLSRIIADNRKGSADLCAYFILRAWGLICKSATLGFVATSSIAEGDTREVCLDFLLSNGATIYQAVQSQAWPGSASVTVTPISLTNSWWDGKSRLNNRIVSGINSYLYELGTISGSPHRLASNSMLSFQGSVVHGKGFLLNRDEAYELIQKNSKNSKIIHPYLKGNEFNSTPDHSPSTYVINFYDWSLKKANEYPECLQIIREKVKPERDKVKRKCYREKWWQFAEKGVNLYKTINSLNRVLFHSFTSKYVAFSFVPSALIYAAPHVVFALDKYEHFAVLQSTIHESWVRRYTSYSLSLARYTPTDCFVTFPFPKEINPLHEIGKSYFEYRQKLMLKNHEGLIGIYNRFNDADDNTNEIIQLRKLRMKMDAAVINLYGWNDIELQHGFHNTVRDGIRFTISKNVRREILQRMLKLNHERYEEEVRQGLHDKKNKKTKSKTSQRKKKTKISEDKQGTLF